MSEWRIAKWIWKLNKRETQKHEGVEGRSGGKAGIKS